MKKLAWCLGFAAAQLVATAVLAQNEDNEAEGASEDAATSGAEAGPQGAESTDADTFGHGAQFGLRLGAVWGYRMVFRYPDSPFCVDPDTDDDIEHQQKFCGHNGPWALDVGLSYGVFDAVEPFLWARFGLSEESQTDTEKVFILGAGARIYTMSDSAFKIFVEPAIGFELEGGAGNELYDPEPGGPWVPADWESYDPEYKRDLIFHVAAGPHWDFAREFGAYLSAGLTVGVLRYIHASMELQAGVQVRLP